MNAPYWTFEPGDLLRALDAGPSGLTSEEAARRLARDGPNALARAERQSTLRAFAAQFQNPLAWLLAFAATVSAVLKEWTDAGVVIGILLVSAVLSFFQERRATRAVEALRARVRVRAQVLRDGAPLAIPAEEVVRGDVVLLSAGSLIPADAAVLEAKDFFVTEAVLTGETFPVEKRPGPSPADAPIAHRTGCVFMGTSVRSGTARALVAATGRETEFGHVSARLVMRPPETDFERGIRRFGYLLMRIMIVLVMGVFAVNVLSQKPPVESMLFAIALAVGLAPEMLPAIITVTLARGAQAMARRGVIVRRLNAIENFGAMDVLCTDKTGTLTLGVVKLDRAAGPDGDGSAAVERCAFINAAFQTGLVNPLDEALMARARETGFSASEYDKVDEVPYDFVRKRLSVVVRDRTGAERIVMKGAFERVLQTCTHVRRGDAEAPLDDAERGALVARFRAWSNGGFRVLGVATKRVDPKPIYTKDDERDLVFEGYLLFFDPPKPDVAATVGALARLGVSLKIITGDSREVAVHLAQSVGIELQGVLTGAELMHTPDEALWTRAERTSLFAEVDPNQKERIILALRKRGHVVGYMGDGINDAPALHAADVGISVESAVDVAREAADFVLLRADLDVLRAGIEEGRITFANTLKYIFTTESANFGNMLSMALSSLFLPFLPLLATQILLNNFLADVPATTIATDRVDPELVAQPRRWDIRFLRNLMVVFGSVSTAFDMLTFGALLFVVHAAPPLFRTAWFLESLLTELLVALVVRTRRPMWRSRPSTMLAATSAAVIALAIALPYSPLGRLFAFVAMPAHVTLLVIAISVTYVLVTETVKRPLFSRVDRTVLRAPGRAPSTLATR